MAERRTICKSISISEQVNDCSLLAIIAFTWGIVHADDWGIITGRPRRFRCLVMPMLPASDEEVARALDELVEHELVVRYTVGGEPWLWFPSFDKYQQGLHKRTALHHCPTPADADEGSISAPHLCAPWLPGPSGNFRELPGNSGHCPEALGNSGLARARGNETKRNETKRSEVRLPQSDPTTDGVCASADASARSGSSLKLTSPPIKPETPVQQIIRRAWNAYGFEGTPPSKGYSGLVKLVQTKGIPLLEEFLRCSNGSLPGLPEGADPAAWFADQLRSALNKPWEWQPKPRTRASPLIPHEADIWSRPQRLEE